MSSALLGQVMVSNGGHHQGFSFLTVEANMSESDVFRSMKVGNNSKTPYSDATQVSSCALEILPTSLCLSRFLALCTFYEENCQTPLNRVESKSADRNWQSVVAKPN